MTAGSAAYRPVGKLALAVVLLVAAAVAGPASAPAYRIVKGRPSLERKQWDLRAIGIPSRGLSERHGLAKVIVATIDTGVDLNHPDLRGRFWRNPRRTPAPLGQGTVPKGAHGWDLKRASPRLFDAGGHGTIVAGQVAARDGNGFGIDGIAPNARVMAMRACTRVAGGELTCQDGPYAAAIDWAADHGARIIHLSWSFGGGPAVAAAVASHPGVLFVTIAGNGGGLDVDAGSVVNNCTLPSPNLICVAASTHRAGRGACTSIGPRSVDIAAPGADITTTLKRSRYLIGGTCAVTFAGPHVTGVAALLLGRDPGADPATIKQAILDGARPSPAFAGLTVSGGIIDAPGALAALRGLRPPPP
jgi:subtilisin family serine protease